MLYVICLCEDSASEPPEPPDDPEDYVMILVACLSIAGVALIVILVICLKKRSYSEWKSIDIHHLGHDTMYIAEVMDVVEEPAATPFIAFPQHS